MSLRQAWDERADAWVRWARAPGHDSYWRFHGARFLELLPPPGYLTIDVGAGEGRVGRDLVTRGHRVVAIDASFRMVRAAASHVVRQPVVVGNAAQLPFHAAVSDLVVAFMSLHDIDDLDGAVEEISRILVPGGRLCLAVVHPLNSAGKFEGDRHDRNAPFVIRGSYLQPFRYADDIERDGLAMTFHSEHRSVESYSRALERSGLVIEAIREVTQDDSADRWHRIPLFLHIKAVRP